MKLTHDLVVITGQYKDSNGFDKNRYLKIGTVFDDEKGPKIKIDVTPINWDGWALMYRAEKKEYANG